MIKLYGIVFSAAFALGASLSASAAPPFGKNLIINGDAEADAGSNNGATTGPVTAFSTTGNFTVVQYGAAGGFPAVSNPGPANRGLNFFAGGPDIDVSTGSQLIDVSSGSSLIDAGGVSFDVSAFLGGFDGQRDSAVLSLSFLNAASSPIGSASLGPVTNTDRSGVTGLLFREDKGIVPIGTRSVQLTLTLSRVDGSYDDGYADNLSLVFTPVPEPLAALQLLVFAGGVGALASFHRRKRQLSR